MELRDIRTYRSDDSRNLVTKHRWHWDNIVSSKQQIGVAQARCLHIDKNFASYRRGNLNVLEIESSAECINYKCLHSVIPSLGECFWPFRYFMLPCGARCSQR
jgi:hypothetical protein